MAQQLLPFIDSTRSATTHARPSPARVIPAVLERRPGSVSQAILQSHAAQDTTLALLPHAPASRSQRGSCLRGPCVLHSRQPPGGPAAPWVTWDVLAPACVVGLTYTLAWLGLRFTRRARNCVLWPPLVPLDGVACPLAPTSWALAAITSRKKSRKKRGSSGNSGRAQWLHLSKALHRPGTSVEDIMEVDQRALREDCQIARVWSDIFFAYTQLEPHPARRLHEIAADLHSRNALTPMDVNTLNRLIKKVLPFARIVSQWAKVACGSAGLRSGHGEAGQEPLILWEAVLGLCARTDHLLNFGQSHVGGR